VNRKAHKTNRIEVAAGAIDDAPLKPEPQAVTFDQLFSPPAATNIFIGLSVQVALDKPEVTEEDNDAGVSPFVLHDESE